jgi:hypothetical protein
MIELIMQATSVTIFPAFTVCVRPASALGAVFWPEEGIVIIKMNDINIINTVSIIGKI